MASNTVFAGGYPAVDGHAIVPYNAIDHDGDVMYHRLGTSSKVLVVGTPEMMSSPVVPRIALSGLSVP